MKSQYTYLLLILVFLTIIGACGYYYLGGFEKVEVYELAGEKRLMAGRQFSGRQTSHLRNEIFAETRKLIRDSVMRGTLAVVSYHHDTLRPNELSQFIGFILPDTTMGEIPLGYEVREFQSQKRLAIFLTMHWFVTPGPHKIEVLLRERAEGISVVLEDYFFEIYYYDDSMSVEGWVK